MWSPESFALGFMSTCALMVLVVKLFLSHCRYTRLYARVSPHDQDRLSDSLFEHFGIPRNEDGYQCTILKSRRCKAISCIPDYREPLYAKFVQAVMIAPTVLGLVYDCPFLRMRREQEMKKPGATCAAVEFIVGIVVPTPIQPTAIKTEAIEKMMRASPLLSQIRFTGECIEHFDE